MTEFKVGDVVQLTCGGPRMTVDTVGEEIRCLSPRGGGFGIVLVRPEVIRKVCPEKKED